MKRIIVVLIALLAGISVVACAENEQTPIAPELDVIHTDEVYDIFENELEVTNGGASINEILSNAPYLLQSQNEIILVGYVVDVSSQFFYIQNEGESAVMKVDFRGSQAFPQIGDEIIISGQLKKDCCDPRLFMLRAMSFEIGR
ncbi:MAG: hypothetical protein FWC20_00795 [Oscillospiraceae bacterium]|nr:hypothetical protein [Oscillospiraceae bacterium]MCL2277931.1 hypothetical protein [Oscillospiraceae bacterium]